MMMNINLLHGPGPATLLPHRYSSPWDTRTPAAVAAPGQGPAPHVAQGAAVVSMAHGDLVMAHDPWDFCFEVSELSWINVGQEPWRFGSLDCC